MEKNQRPRKLILCGATSLYPGEPAPTGSDTQSSASGRLAVEAKSVEWHAKNGLENRRRPAKYEFAGLLCDQTAMPLIDLPIIPVCRPHRGRRQKVALPERPGLSTDPAASEPAT